MVAGLFIFVSEIAIALTGYVKRGRVRDGKAASWIPLTLGEALNSKAECVRGGVPEFVTPRQQGRLRPHSPCCRPMTAMRLLERVSGTSSPHPNGWMPATDAHLRLGPGATGNANAGMPSVADLRSLLAGAFMGAGRLRHRRVIGFDVNVWRCGRRA